MKVEHKPGARPDLERAIKDLARKQARMGFFPHSQYADGTPVAYVATIQEFGYPTGGIPSRPFFRPTIAEQRTAWRDSLAKGSRAVMRGRLTTEQMLTQFGLSAAGDVKKTISLVMTPELAESTIEARRSRRKTPGVSTKPLVDTGYMLSQVDADVVDK
jgi:hypothetical protein